MVTEHVTRRRQGVVEMADHAHWRRRVVVVVVVVAVQLMPGYLPDTALRVTHSQQIPAVTDKYTRKPSLEVAPTNLTQPVGLIMFFNCVSVVCTFSAVLRRLRICTSSHNVHP